MNKKRNKHIARAEVMAAMRDIQGHAALFLKIDDKAVISAKDQETMAAIVKQIVVNAHIAAESWPDWEGK